MNSSTTSPHTTSTQNSLQNLSAPAPVKAWRHDARLPQLAKNKNSKLVQDVYDSILWRIDAKSLENETQAVGLTGCSHKCGVSTIAADLAVCASSQQRGRVLLIDANWDPPGLVKTFNLTSGQGIYDILSGEVSPRECAPQQVSEYLDVLSRGLFDEEQAVHVRPELVADVLSDFRTEYSLILVDLPPADALRSAVPLARQLDGSLLVTRFEAVKKPQAQRALERLHEDGVPVWGSILNRHREYVPKWLRHWL